MDAKLAELDAKEAAVKAAELALAARQKEQEELRKELVCVYACMRACTCGPRGLRSARPLAQAGCAARVIMPGSSGRLRYARPSGVIKEVALCAASRGHQEGCALRGIPGSLVELRCARLRGSARCAGPMWKVSGRFREAAPRAVSRSADPGMAQVVLGCLGEFWCCLARPKHI